MGRGAGLCGVFLTPLPRPLAVPAADAVQRALRSLLGLAGAADTANFALAADAVAWKSRPRCAGGGGGGGGAMEAADLPPFVAPWALAVPQAGRKDERTMRLCVRLRTRSRTLILCVRTPHARSYTCKRTHT